MTVNQPIQAVTTHPHNVGKDVTLRGRTYRITGIACEYNYQLDGGGYYSAFEVNNALPTTYTVVTDAFPHISVHADSDSDYVVLDAVAYSETDVTVDADGVAFPHSYGKRLRLEDTLFAVLSGNVEALDAMEALDGW